MVGLMRLAINLITGNIVRFKAMIRITVRIIIKMVFILAKLKKKLILGAVKPVVNVDMLNRNHKLVLAVVVEVVLVAVIVRYAVAVPADVK